MKKLQMILLVLIVSIGLCMPVSKDVSAAALKAKISVNCGTTSSKGDVITIKGSSTGGKGTKKYKYRYKFSGEMYTIKGYSTSKSVKFTPKKNGTYKFYVYVKAGSTVKSTSKTVKVAALSASLSQKSVGYVNTRVTLSGSASGGFGSKKYKFSYTLNGDTTVLKNYSSTKTCTFKATEPGTYKCKVTCKDEKGRTASKTKSVSIITVSDEELELRQEVIDVAEGWLGVKEGSSGHKEIIKTYNSEKNNMYIDGEYSHYDAKISDAWCDIFTSACFIKAGYKVISGVECGCERHVNLLNEKLCSWVEDDDYIPTKGDIIFYDWDDDGKGDCTGHSDHVGIVVSVNNNKIKVIEGNKDPDEGEGSKDLVGYRTIRVNGRYIRGFGVPKYFKL
ncbi:MAG: triple tyrosine motif-containing protein [Lachnospiraceae bacterium]|nr:triple tyrosine motif-containing protein [Lachnospiraceae bacterium]